MATARVVLAEAASHRGDLAAICAVSMTAWMLAAFSQEGIGHGLTALLTDSQWGVLSAAAWSSAHDTRLLAAGGTLVNPTEAGLLWIALRSAKRASVRTRLLLFAACPFNLFTGTGCFLFSSLGNFGDWGIVIAGKHPSWLWQALMVIAGTAGYYGAMPAMDATLVRYVDVAWEDKPRMKRLTWLVCFSALGFPSQGD
jgi:hypothetical protein